MPTPSLSRSTSSPRRGQQTRERVLRAASEQFAARGFAPVTMRSIGDASGIDNSSLYRHFASKSELAREVLDRAMAKLASAAASDEAPFPATRDGVIDFVTGVALHLWDHPDTARLLLHWVTSSRDASTGFDVSLPAAAIDAPSGDVFRGVADLLARAQGAGEIRTLNWPEAFVAVVGAIALRPATYRSFLESQEPERSQADARAAWESEVRHLLRGMLEP